MDGIVGAVQQAGEVTGSVISNTTEAISGSVEQTGALLGDPTVAPEIFTVQTATGAESADAITNQVVATGPDDTFERLSKIDLHAQSVQAAFDSDKIIAFPQSTVVDSPEPTAAVANDEVYSESGEMQENQPIDLSKHKQQKEEEQEEMIDSDRNIDHEKTDEEKKREETLTFLQNNPELLDAMTNLISLSEDQIKELIEKIQKLKAQEKDKKAQSLFELLLAILFGTLATVQEETAQSMKPAA